MWFSSLDAVLAFSVGVGFVVVVSGTTPLSLLSQLPTASGIVKTFRLGGDRDVE